MIGGGTVGSGVFNALQQNAELMAARTGVRLVVRKVAVKAFDEPRPYPITPALMTLNWKDVVEDPEIQIVTELVGGTGIAKVIVLAALERGKAVVTANKALLSAHGPELFAAAKRLAPTFTTRPASPVAFRSSRPCARHSSATVLKASMASSTAPAITSSPA